MNQIKKIQSIYLIKVYHYNITSNSTCIIPEDTVPICSLKFVYL